MIILKTLTWSNVFSYGVGNTIDLCANPITQLVGLNGHGKSSIPLIIEEVLYNKNSKNIKRSDILNRYTNDKKYSIILTFDKNNESYEIITSRGTTQTVKLLCNGEDISAHTASGTYKLIEEIIGFDHKTFAQLIYQSSSSSLEFLTSTDTTRKKFLIDLLNLSRYTEIFEVFKTLSKEIETEVTSVSSKVKTIQSWINKHINEDFSLKEPVIVPQEPVDLLQEISTIEHTIAGIEATNKDITKNLQYRKLLDAVDKSVEKVEVPVIDEKALISERAVAVKSTEDAGKFITKMRSLKDTCPTCLQTIDSDKVKSLVLEQMSLATKAEELIASIDDDLKKLYDAKAKLDKYVKSQAEWEKYYSLYDPTKPQELLDEETLTGTLSDLKQQVKEIQKVINTSREYNSGVDKHNSKIEVVKQQLEEMHSELRTHTEYLDKISSRLVLVNTLQKTFSTNGLVAYKIEFLIKDLEGLVNQYLAELSDGRFQLTFKVSGTDKLNVIITDNGNDIDIMALSSGERARVNTATLLAIRRLMQSLSNARINLLILDETIDTLDADGREKLVEVLLTEDKLNTFLISHSYSHPLIEKIQIIKEHNISRIE